MSGGHGHDGHGGGHGGHVGGHADAWHHHEAAEGLPQEEHGGTTSIAAMAKGLFLIAFATVGLVAVTMLYLNHHMGQLRRQRADADLSEQYNAYREASKTRMNGYGWVDSETPRVPTTVAKERVLKKYEGK
jgi:hypothetical protein